MWMALLGDETEKCVEESRAIGFQLVDAQNRVLCGNAFESERLERVDQRAEIG